MNSAVQFSSEALTILNTLYAQALANVYDPSNTDTGATSVTINAKKGLAVFTQSIGTNGYATFTINNSFISNAGKIPKCTLMYNVSTGSLVGKPCILFVDAFEGDEYFNVEVKNESGTDATDGDIYIYFEIEN